MLFSWQPHQFESLWRGMQWWPNRSNKVAVDVGSGFTLLMVKIINVLTDIRSESENSFFCDVSLAEDEMDGTLRLWPTRVYWKIAPKKKTRRRRSRKPKVTC